MNNSNKNNNNKNNNNNNEDGQQLLLPNLFYVDTGNLLCSETLKRKAALLPSDEVIYDG